MLSMNNTTNPTVRPRLTTFAYDGTDDWKHTVFTRSTCWRGEGEGCAHCGKSAAEHADTGHCWSLVAEAVATDAVDADLPF